VRESAANPPCVVSVIVADDQGNGHVFPYAESVGQACALNGWKHLGLVPRGVPLERVPRGWRRTLPQPGRSRLRSFAEFRRAFRSELDELTREPREVFLFVDPTTVTTLAALWAAMTPAHARVRVCLMFRYDANTSRGELPAYRWLARGFVWKLGPERVLGLTDSEPLREFLRQVLRREMHVLPIPHTFPPAPDRVARAGVVCWWPGKPLANKGRAILQRLASTSAPGAEEFTLVAAKSAGWQRVSGGPQIDLLADRLDEKEYADQMARADVVLLPYDPAVYRRRTSGIFVEAVVAGKLPVVSAGTWAGSELVRYGLPELAWSEWEPATVYSRLRSMLADDALRRRLAVLQQRFAQEHSVPGYAAALRRVFA
jgi:hypothetical protein